MLRLLVFHHGVLTCEHLTTSVTLKVVFIWNAFCGDIAFHSMGVDLGMDPITPVTMVAGALGKVSTICGVLLLSILHYGVIVWEFVGAIFALQQICIFDLHWNCGYFVLRLYMFQQVLKLNGLINTFFTRNYVKKYVKSKYAKKTCIFQLQIF